MSTAARPTRAYVRDTDPATLAVYARREANHMRQDGARADLDPQQGRPTGAGIGNALNLWVMFDGRSPVRIYVRQGSRGKERTVVSFGEDYDQAAQWFEQTARRIREAAHRDRLTNDPDAINERGHRLASLHRTGGGDGHRAGAYVRGCFDCDGWNGHACALCADAA